MDGASKLFDSESALWSVTTGVYGLAGKKVAVTPAEEVPMMKLHVPVPAQTPPLQPAKNDPGVGAAVRVTAAPVPKMTEQVAPQLIPAGELLTVPDPVPASVTLTGKEDAMKLALTNNAEFRVTIHAPDPLQAPLQPEKADPTAAVGVRVTTVPRE